jgi:hypothetical protein
MFTGMSQELFVPIFIAKQILQLFSLHHQDTEAA